MFRDLLSRNQLLCQQAVITARVLKLNKGLRFARKPVNFNVSRSAAPKLALVPACHYNCDVKSHTLMSVPSFIRIERGSDRSPCPQTSQGASVC